MRYTSVWILAEYSYSAIASTGLDPTIVAVPPSAVGS